MTELSLDAFVHAAENVPYQQVNSELIPNIDLWVRRDDLIDPIISGNKAYKLIYNLLEARKLGKDTIVTWGGAWSNHIHATAAAGQRFGFKTIGIIRGERPPVLSAMLQDAERFGMNLRFVSRQKYQQRGHQGFVESLGFSSSCYFIPEGGANYLGAQGILLMADTIQKTKPVEFDEYWVACGTGLTVGGLCVKLGEKSTVVGVPVLKAEEQIEANAQNWAATFGNGSCTCTIVRNAHLGGYAKQPKSLLGFIKLYEKYTTISLEGVYTGKTLKAITLKSEPQPSAKHCRKSVLMVHTGGLQGRRGVLCK
ncbi:pyridoxal-phosphate dependent enzyme [Microbulbifer agarilyticus]|uniref:1-aminocyclopropane-1-carboxylate deaminase/D-cysteine desulfhydrase n=1 Tax=Microbulbifer agarilyticus TaxID=260552 RepID=UPI001C945D52|nr:pyridoxal-phosphate dependent enzyme [Microbulbifer agarilyticus]MBY6212228.1 pyridoxal-phosphate dependent enzyme [Microbulbifer agarilyticus]